MPAPIRSTDPRRRSVVHIIVALPSELRRAGGAIQGATAYRSQQVPAGTHGVRFATSQSSDVLGTVHVTDGSPGGTPAGIGGGVGHVGAEETGPRTGATVATEVGMRVGYSEGVGQGEREGPEGGVVFKAFALRVLRAESGAFLPNGLRLRAAARAWTRTKRRVLDGHGSGGTTMAASVRLLEVVPHPARRVRGIVIGP